MSRPRADRAWASAKLRLADGVDRARGRRDPLIPPHRANPHYNPDGRQPADGFSFPYPDDQFDLVLATAVFTHLLTADAVHYLAAIARVLAPTGRLFSTWFLLDGDLGAEKARPTIDFRHAIGDAIVVDPNAPAGAVAYPGHCLQAATDSTGMALDAVIRGFADRDHRPHRPGRRARASSVGCRPSLNNRTERPQLGRGRGAAKVTSRVRPRRE